jgi:predicted TIM-barrel fold metal-dependent hydrolase
MYDTSSSLWYLDPDHAVKIIGKLGYGRVMFGTDYPVMYPASELRLFEKLRLPDSVREDILYNNAARFLQSGGR